jgi:hypothetical protein
MAAVAFTSTVQILLPLKIYLCLQPAEQGDAAYRNDSAIAIPHLN